MQLQLEEARAMVIKEREAARKAIAEAPPVIKETPVIIQDTEKIDSLTAELQTVKVKFPAIPFQKLELLVFVEYSIYLSERIYWELDWIEFSCSLFFCSMIKIYVMLP